MYAADVFSIRYFKQEGHTFELVIDECAAHAGTVKAGYAFTVSAIHQWEISRVSWSTCLNNSFQ